MMVNKSFLPFGETTAVESSLPALEIRVSGFDAIPIADFMLDKQNELRNILKRLQISNPAVSEIADDIVSELHIQSKDDFIISHTGDNELLIYRKIGNDEYRNLIIDEDGDVVYMRIPSDRRETYHIRYPFIMGINPTILASKM